MLDLQRRRSAGMLRVMYIGICLSQNRKRLMFACKPILSAVFLLALASDAGARVWSDASGKFTTEAELFEAREGQVWLKRDGESPFPVALSRLSKEDQEYVTALSALGRAHDPSRPLIPPPAVRLLNACAQQRAAEIKRREVRLESLRRSSREARGKAPRQVAKQFTDEIEEHTGRIKAIEREAIYIPQLSPEGMPGAPGRNGFPDGLREGQIGSLDEGFTYSGRVSDAGELIITALRRELSYGRPPVAAIGIPLLQHNHKSAPYAPFIVEGMPDGLIGEPHDRDPNSTLNVELRKRVFVVHERPNSDRGGRQLVFVLKPFDLAPINAWLKEPLVAPRWRYPENWKKQ